MNNRKKSNTGYQGRVEPDKGMPQDKKRQWYKVDLHLHSPASNDYEEPKATYLEWMRRAAAQELDIVAITDHNTVAGIEAIRDEIEWLTRLEERNRLTDEERKKLDEWRQLSEKVLVLPGFEFTATFGFHILGIFAPDTPVRQLEHVLLQLKVPVEKLHVGSTETGASTDVLTAYRVIREAGGIVIAAHANSTHGVAMRDFPFGGQTKIAYTQDPNLDALEVTDLEKRSQSTMRFFNGSKAEYPRRMHCIQGSDAHRLVAEEYKGPKTPGKGTEATPPSPAQRAGRAKRLGIGDRTTELLLEAPTFEAIRDLLRSNNFERTRPARPKDQPFDPLAVAREEGPGIDLGFHETATQRGGRLTAILSDICAFANTVGGTIYIGASQRNTVKPKGLDNPKEIQEELQAALSERLIPPIEPKFEVVQSQGAKVLRLQIPKGKDRPYCLDDYKFYIRDESDTSLALRDEVVALVKEVLAEKSASERRAERPDQRPDNRPQSDSRSGRRRGGKGSGSSNSSSGGESSGGESPKSVPTPQPASSVSKDDAFYLPQVGVEIVDTQQRNGHPVHSVRDLRNGRVIKNVSRKGARKLWNYAIGQHEDNPVDAKKVQWKENIGLIQVETRAGKQRYNLALRENGTIRVFYGVTEDGMEGRWAAFIQEE